MINPRKMERVSRAICKAAGRYSRPDSLTYSPDDPPYISKYPCKHCWNEKTKQEECFMWYTFKDEAEAAIGAMKGI